MRARSLDHMWCHFCLCRETWRAHDRPLVFPWGTLISDLARAIPPRFVNDAFHSRPITRAEREAFHRFCATLLKS